MLTRCIMIVTTGMLSCAAAVAALLIAKQSFFRDKQLNGETAIKFLSMENIGRVSVKGSDYVWLGGLVGLSIGVLVGDAIG